MPLSYQCSKTVDFWPTLCIAYFIAAGDMDHSGYDCFALAVLSHGDEENAFYDIDGKLFTLAELMAPIKKCTTLAGKPKICIIQVSHLMLLCYAVFLCISIRTLCLC